MQRAKRSIPVLLLWSVTLLGCPKPVTPQEAKALYRKEQVACVVVSKTEEESQACRAEVDKRWGVRRER